MNTFCRCGYLPRIWNISDPMVGSVPVRRLVDGQPDLTRCQAVGVRWFTSGDSMRTRCAQAPKRTVEGVPLCLRHARIATCTLPHDDRAVRERWYARVARYEQMPVVITDGGRKDAGPHFRHAKGDCVYRSIAIVEQRPYAEVANALFMLGASKRMNGVPGFVYEGYLFRFGWIKTKPKGIFLRKGMLPQGRLLVHISRHMLAVIDGTIYDTFDSSVRGTKRVQAYYTRQPMLPPLVLAT